MTQTACDPDMAGSNHISPALLPRAILDPGMPGTEAFFRLRTGAQTMKTIGAIAALVAAAILTTILVIAGATRAAEDRAFGPKPWLLAPAPAKLTPLQKHRASVYRSNLQREIRRLELRGPLTDIRSIDRKNAFQSELSRINRAARARRPNPPMPGRPAQRAGRRRR